MGKYLIAHVIIRLMSDSVNTSGDRRESACWLRLGHH